MYTVPTKNHVIVHSQLFHGPLQFRHAFFGIMVLKDTASVVGAPTASDSSDGADNKPSKLSTSCHGSN